MTFARSVNPEDIVRALPLAGRLLQSKRAPALTWRDRARPEQLPPDGFGDTLNDWYIRGGRGSGKTWDAAHALAEQIISHPPGDWGVVAPTYADVRDTCMEGESGLLAALGPRGGYWATWNRSMGELKLSNGATVFADGADDGALRVQGKNLRGVWADEVGLWKATKWEQAWDESIGFAVRIAPAIRIATGTPKRGHPLPKRLAADPLVAQSLLLTEDNIANLDPATVERWQARWGGTTLGRQELRGELLEDSEGALWSRGLIRYRSAPHMSRIVIAIDPAVSSSAESDETGIIAAGLGIDTLGYVLEDRSRQASPAIWAREAIDLYHRRKADIVVAEANNGGEMVSLTLGTVDANVPVTLVHASRGKQARAEPIVSLYEQGRVFHEDPLPELEDQLCNWDPREGGTSPDRLDALVWAMTNLMLDSWGSPSGSASSIA